MKIDMTATYDDSWYESDEPDTEPSREGGFTNPRNPWGGWKQALPDNENPGPEWYKENVTHITFYGVKSAAEFALEFPGGVWDYSESEFDTVDYRTGLERAVTLHINTHAAEVFARMETIEKGKKK